MVAVPKRSTAVVAGEITGAVHQARDPNALGSRATTFSHQMPSLSRYKRSAVLAVDGALHRGDEKFAAKSGVGKNICVVRSGSPFRRRLGIDFDPSHEGTAGNG